MHRLRSLDTPRLSRAGKADLTKLEPQRRKRPESLRAGQNRLLEMIATSAPLTATLDGLVRLIETQIPDTTCSILLLDTDGQHLHLGAAPSLPDAYNAAIDGIAIGPNVGSCGTAAFRREPIYVSDIASDPLWTNYKELALGHGLRACWSTPIMTHHGELLGTFAMYHRDICKPGTSEKRIVGMATHIATIAIQAERSQQRLQQQLFFMQQLVDAIPCPIFFKDAQGRYLGGNQSYEALIGMPREQFIGKTVYDVAPRELAEKYIIADQSLYDNPGSQVYEATLRGADGSTRNVMFHKATFSNADGSPGGLVGAIMDITEVKRAEARWNMAAREAEIANRAKSNFLAQMSHELRTPLNAIIGFSEAMKLEIFGPLTNPFYQSYAADIHQSGHLLLSLINDILDLSKIEAGKQQLSVEPLDLRDLMTGAVHLVERHAREAQVRLTLDMAEHGPALTADRRAVIRIVLNLLSNAIKFTPAGGNVELHCSTANDGVEIVVEDTGTGMSPEQIPVAMSVFGQLNNVYTRGHQGTGLGLPMVKALAEQHGGNLRIDTALGKGTTVTVWLPAEARIAVTEESDYAQLS